MNANFLTNDAEARAAYLAYQDLKAFMLDQQHRMHTNGFAVGLVSMWGRVAPGAPDDDWQYAARAQYAQLVDFVHVNANPGVEDELRALYLPPHSTRNEP